MSNFRGHERRQGDRRPQPDFQKYREICPAGVSDETLHTIIRKHKDKADKQDLIAADIGALYDSPRLAEESWQSTGKPKKKKEVSYPSSDRSGGRGRGRDARGAPTARGNGGRGNGQLVRRIDTPRPNSTELLAAEQQITPPSAVEEEPAPVTLPTQPIAQKEKAQAVEVKAPAAKVAAGGAWGNKGLSLAEKLQRQEEVVFAPPPAALPPLVAPVPIVPPVSVLETVMEPSAEKEVSAEMAPAKDKDRKGRSRKVRGGQKSAAAEDSTPPPESEAEKDEKIAEIVHDDVEGTTMNDLFITGKAISIVQETPAPSVLEEQVQVAAPAPVEIKPVEKVSKTATPQRKSKKDAPRSPKGVILGNFDVEEEDAGFSFGSFGEEATSPQRQSKGKRGAKSAPVQSEAPPAELSMDSFLNSKQDASSSPAIVEPPSLVVSAPTESFGSVGSLSAGPPGFSAPAAAPANTAPIQQPSSTKSRKSKGNKDHQQQNQQQNQDPFGQSSAPPGMQSQQQGQQQGQGQQRGQQQQAFSSSTFGVNSADMYGLGGAPGLGQSPLMGGSYDSIYGGHATKSSSDLGSSSSSSNATPPSSNSPAASSSPNLGFQGQQSQQPLQQGYPPAQGMGQMGAPYFHPYANPYANPYFGNPYFGSHGQQPPNFYGGRGGQNMYAPRAPYGSPEGFGAGGQGMGYDMYGQGGMSGQYDSAAALNYNQQMQMQHHQQHSQQQPGSVSDGGVSSSGIEGGSRQKNSKHGAGNSQGAGNSNMGGQGNLLHDNAHAPHNNFGGAGVGSGYNNQFSGRQDQFNMYAPQQQGSYTPMMPPFSQQSLGGAPGAGLGGGYSQGGNSGYSRGGNANNYSGNSRGGGGGPAQNSSAMSSSSGGNSGSSAGSSSTAPSAW